MLLKSRVVSAMEGNQMQTIEIYWQATIAP